MAELLLQAPVAWVVALVALQRLAEMAVARRNTARLMAGGGREIGRAHYPLFVVLHASWLAAILATTPADRIPDAWLLGLYAVLQLLRLWVMATLGRYWTTRIITVDGAPLVRGGPYRFLRHPNYWVVAAEIAVLPLAFANWPVAVLWSILNAALLRHRIRVEAAALAARRSA
ncbi:membrane protein [Allostella vacuolata]|nr:membrane protein [Stella vacuolata]